MSPVPTVLGNPLHPSKIPHTKTVRSRDSILCPTEAGASAMTETLYVRHGRLHYFVREALKRLRLPATHASKVGDALVAET